MKKIVLFLISTLLSGCANQIQQGANMNLPEYVSINDDTIDDEHKKVLRTVGKELNFPLSSEDRESVNIVEAKFDQEKNMAGLAAPQIGISKKIIVFAAPDNVELKKWRPDHHQFIDKTIWINAKYEGIGTEKHSDFEGCFSVKDIAGEVPRFKKIKYEAYTPDGKHVHGIAEGYLARVMQHEIDHTNGILFIDYLTKEEQIPIEEYREIRKQALKNGRE